MDRKPGVVSVIGATGFVGRHVVARLQECGYTVRAVSRHGTRRADWADSVQPLAANVETGAGLGAAMVGADAVVHLVAIPRESDGRTFAAVNVDGVRNVLQAMRAAGVRRIVHLSVLGVTDEPGYRYLSSKWRGEKLVRESGLDWVVLRPSIMFGPGDGFFRLIDTTLRWWSPGVVAIPATGTVRFQPLAAADLAVAVERCLAEPARAGSVYELGGPDYLTYPQLVDAVMAATDRRRLKLPVPVPLLRALTYVSDRVLPVFPVSHDQVASLGRPNYTDADAFQATFGIAPRPLNLSYLSQDGGAAG
ncbi:MAG TPA: NAD(P)H-binding protein [Candidatus Limnocylindria bacterium]|nr:NAD(P)H-binding protein [Candidatus Limnocylindria bacterium]